MRRIYNKKFEEWPNDLRKELYVTNFQLEGYMQYTVERYPDTDTFAMLDKGRLIGWALVDPTSTAMFFVKSEYRKQGVATRLGQRIQRKYGKRSIKMMPHDRASFALEAKLYS